MLTWEQIKFFYAGQNIQAKNILVEYLQAEILDSLFKQEDSRYLSFMGGTALRTVYGGNRFSEDLDFDNFGMSFAKFSALVGAMARDMELKGFILETRAVKKEAFHCYIKFPAVLQKAGISPLGEEKILIRIDTVRKKKFFTPENFRLTAFDLYRNLRVNPLPIILAQKILAGIERKREKGRDFYDINLFWSRVEPDFGYLEKYSGLNRKEIIEKLYRRSLGLNFKKLAKDVEPFLIKPDQIERVEGFKEFLQVKIQ